MSLISKSVRVLANHSPTKPNSPDATLLLKRGVLYLMQFADCGNRYPLSRCHVINNIFARQRLRERFDTRSCSVEALRCLYEI